MIFYNQLEPKTLNAINKKLKDTYGLSELKQNFILTWVDENLREMRLCSHSIEGFQYVQPRYEERKKYGYINRRYVLEKLCVVPAQDGMELVEVLSYEPLWVFQTAPPKMEPLYPKWRAMEFVIENVLEAARVGKYYSKPIQDPDLEPDAKHKRINALMHELYGNETDTGDALAYKEGISVPSTFKILGGE